MNKTKKYFFAALLPLGLLCSCGNNGDDTSAGNKDSLDTANGKKDTVTFTIESITEEAYCQQTAAMNFCAKKMQDGWEFDSLAEIGLMKKHSDLLTRKGNELVINTKKGKKTYVSKYDPSGESDDVISYNVHAVYNRLVVLKIYEWESYSYLVVDLENGQDFSTWGLPVVYKEQLIIAGNTDLMAGFTNNGLQLYALKDDNWQLQMEKLLDDWGPQDLYWINDETVLSKKLSLTQTDSGEVYKTEYVKILMKQEKID